MFKTALSLVFCILSNTIQCSKLPYRWYRFAFYRLIYNIQNILITVIGTMGRFALLSNIYNVQNCLITGFSDMGRFAFYQIIYNAQNCLKIIYNVQNCLIIGISHFIKYYTMFKIALSLVSICLLSINIQYSKYPYHCYWYYG